MKINQLHKKRMLKLHAGFVCVIPTFTFRTFKLLRCIKSIVAFATLLEY